MTYISLISWIITKFRLALDMADFSNDMREKMSNFRMKIKNSKLPKEIVHKEDIIIDQRNKLVLRQYSLDSQMSDKAILFFHGGGYAISNIDVYNPVASLMVVSNSFNNAPPPVKTIPRSTISAANSGGVCSNAVFVASII